MTKSDTIPPTTGDAYEQGVRAAADALTMRYVQMRDTGSGETAAELYAARDDVLSLLTAPPTSAGATNGPLSVGDEVRLTGSTSRYTIRSVSRVQVERDDGHMFDIDRECIASRETAYPPATAREGDGISDTNGT